MPTDYLGGDVGINFWPDFTNFKREMDAKLHAMNIPDMSVPVTLDVEDKAFQARKKAIENDPLNLAVNIEGNDAALRALVRKWDGKKVKLNADVTPAFDETKLVDRLSQSMSKVGQVWNKSVSGMEIAMPKGMDSYLSQAKQMSDTWKGRFQSAEKYSKYTQLINKQLRTEGTLEADLTRKVQARQLSLAKQKKTQTQITDQVLLAKDGQTILNTGINDARLSWDKTLRSAKANTDQLEEMRSHILSLQQALNSFKPMGDNWIDNRSANKFRSQISSLMEQVDKDPTFTVDFESLGYEKLMLRLENLVRKTNEVHDQEVRVKFYTDKADALEKQLTRLQKTRLDIPAEFVVDQQAIIRRLREAGEKVKTNPDFKYEVGLDLDMRRAKDKLEDWKERNDELKMDVDLESKLASTHLAYLTRPRTIDIWADFKGTTGGQLIDDMLMGATGLNGVQRNFQRLINTFNNLDTVVPRLTIVGTVLSDIGAGTLNLASTIGGVAQSLGRLAAAAQAAPAILTGLGSAFYGVYAAVKTASDHFDIASTKLGGLKEAVGGAFWKEAASSLTTIANSLAPTLISGLSSIATQEGRVVKGLEDILLNADKTGDLSTIFSNTEEAVRQLNPGLSSLVKGFLDLGTTGSQYLPQMADYLSDMGSKFSAWAAKAADTDRMSAAIENAKEQAGYLKDSLKDLWGIGSGVFGTLAGSENGLQGFAETLDKVNRAVHSTKFQETLKAWRVGAEDAQAGIRGSFDDIGDALYSLRGITSDTMGMFGRLTGNLLSDIGRLTKGSGSGIADFAKGAVKGVDAIGSALADAAPMFSDLLSMAGSLSKTFGGTFANTLKAAAPLIQTMAKATQAVSEAFAKLPSPLQGAIGLLLTFGRAGKSAFDGLKMGMLNNIQQTLQMRSTLGQLGMTTSSAKVGFLDLGRAMVSIRTGGTGLADNLTKTGTAATGLGTAAKTAGSKLGGFKGIASGALGLLGGAPGIILGVGTALASVAWASYSEHAQKAEEAQRKWNDALAEAPSLLHELTGAQDRFTAAAFNEVDIDRDGWDKFFTLASGTHMKEYESAADSFKAVGLSAKEASELVSQGGPAYDKQIKRLQKLVDAGTMTTTSGEMVNNMMDDQASAAKQSIDALQKARESMYESIDSNEDLSDSQRKLGKELLDSGESAEAVSYALLDAGTKAEYAAQASQMLADAKDDESQAVLAAGRAADSYYETLDSMGSRIQQVQALVAQGQGVWDGQATDFNHQSEAGRLASQSLQSLTTQSTDYLRALVEQGKTVPEVQAKQKQMADEFRKTAEAMGVPKEKVEDLLTTYGMTPDTVETLFKADTEKTKTDLLTYLNLIAASFPGKNNTAILRTVTEAITSGAIKDIEDLDKFAKEVTGKGYVTVIDADGTQFRMKKEEVEKLGMELDGDKYTSQFTVEDLASDKIRGFITDLQEAGMTDKNINAVLTASGDGEMKLATVKNLLEGLNLSNKDIEVVLSGSGNAPDMLADVKKKLEDLGYTPKQIDWLLHAIDDVSGPTDLVKNKVASVPKRHDTNVSATDNASGTITNIKNNQARLKDKTFQINENGNAYGRIANLVNWLPGLGSRVGSAISGAAAKLFGRATGGYVTGPGTSTSDSIPTLLSNGEYVIKASTVQKLESAYGSGFLNLVNQTGKIPSLTRKYVASASNIAKLGYASGGKVGAFTVNVSAQTDPALTAEIRGLRNELSATLTSSTRPITQQFQTVIRANDDPYVANTILQNTAIQKARSI